jgi:hypothetical protein
LSIYLIFVFLLFRVPNAVEGHETPELEIFGIDGIPQDDMQRHIDGLPIVPYNKTKMILGDSSILPLLAAQKVSVASQLAESKNLIVQGTTQGPSSVPASSSASTTTTSSTTTTNAPGTGLVSPPTASSSNIIVSPPSSSAPPMPTAFAQATAPGYPQAQNPYYAHPSNPYYQQYYAQQYAAYYQQYYAQQAAQQYNVAQPIIEAVKAEQSNSSTEVASIKGEDSIESIKEEEEANPLEAEVETSIVVPPIVDEANNRMVPGIIFTVPCIDRSIEELRARLKKYKSK